LLVEYALTQSDAAAAGPPPTQPCQSICCGAEELAPSRRCGGVPRAKVAPRREALRSGADEERARARARVCVCVRERARGLAVFAGYRYGSAWVLARS